VRAGLTLVKGTRRKVGRLGEDSPNGRKVCTRVVDTSGDCNRPFGSGSIVRTVQTVSATSAAFRAEKAGGLVRLAQGVGRRWRKGRLRAVRSIREVAEAREGCCRAARLAEDQSWEDTRHPEIGRPWRACFLAAGALRSSLGGFGPISRSSPFCLDQGTNERDASWIDRG